MGYINYVIKFYKEYFLMTTFRVKINIYKYRFIKRKILLHAGK
jgi:hypothetical protein